MRELIYSEELKTWLSPALTGGEVDRRMPEGVPVPSKVLDWLKQSVTKATRDPAFMSRSFRKQHFKAPWRPVPHFVKTMVPKAIDLVSVEARIGEYTFKNSMLFIEALTHASATKASSPPNQRLALIGAPVVELLLVQAIIDRTKFALHAGLIADDRADEVEDIAGREQSQTFSVSALKDETLIWPKQVPSEAARHWLEASRRNLEYATGEDATLKDSDTLLEWVNTVCNHTTYAYVCCQMKLHKHILHNCNTLQESMQEFAKTARRAKVSPANLWPTLSVCDAPRALSDTLLAVVAAVFLDSDWSRVA